MIPQDEEKFFFLIVFFTIIDWCVYVTMKVRIIQCLWEDDLNPQNEFGTHGLMLQATLNPHSGRKKFESSTVYFGIFILK